MQVDRVHPIGSTTSDNIAGLNQAMWNLIAGSNPNSVFLNYQLVDVLWPNMSTSIPAGATTPLTQGDPQPNPAVQPVNNTSLETYIQQATCLDCHASAPISSAEAQPMSVLRIAKPRRSGPASAPRTTSTPIYASDYSFLFSRADASPSSGGFPTLPVAIGVAAAAACAAGGAGLLYRRRRRTAVS
jgi:hypothetical protein